MARNGTPKVVPNSNSPIYRRGDMTGAAMDDWMMKHGWSNTRLAACTRTTDRMVSDYRTGKVGIPGVFTVAMKYAQATTERRLRKGSVRTSLADARRKKRAR